MMETIRVYDNPIRHWTSYDMKGHCHITQYEVPYKEFNLDGRKVRCGTEDFSDSRIHCLRHYNIWLWDGMTTGNVGQRLFDRGPSFTISKFDRHKLPAFLETLFPEARAISIRKV